MKRRSGSPSRPSWLWLLWSLAVLGLLLLPTNYRAGAETAHPHSLLHLWSDAADGSVHHHGLAALDWLDPAVGAAKPIGAAVANNSELDIADQEDSVPPASGVHLLLFVMFVLPMAATGTAPATAHIRHLSSHVPRIPVPPPRKLPAGI